MRAVVQRVSEASVTITDPETSERVITGQIQSGFLVLLGVAQDDEQKDIDYIVQKLCGLRVFEDADGKMNLSIDEAGGSMLIVSQFTLYGDCRKGRRPSFIEAARPEKAEAMYETVCQRIRDNGIQVATGKFQTHMDVALVNDGPVTLMLESRKAF